MSFIQIVVLALIQGVTEFLPISSSGHLILGSWLFNWPDQGLVFDAAVHVGTLIAVVYYFRRQWVQLLVGLRSDRPVEMGGAGGTVPARRLAVLIAVATVPLAIGGALLKDDVVARFRTPESVGWLLIGTAVALALGEIIGSRARNLDRTTVPHAVIVGIAQVFAVLPGISRSGVTIVAGMGTGMTRDAAARFSMLIATPAIAGAGLLVAVDALSGKETVDWGAAALGLLLSGFIAYFVIVGLMKLLKFGSYRPFIVYCAVVGAAVVIARAAGA